MAERKDNRAISSAIPPRSLVGEGVFLILCLRQKPWSWASNSFETARILWFAGAYKFMFLSNAFGVMADSDVDVGTEDKVRELAGNLPMLRGRA